ncbi:hypothetical protein CEXT_502851 [Caerostris extrusa]|uniref:Uncharacterized protein n=1 Tax=Caerostris extrusa TaxID=172846 RepID=A0AAV4SMW3_CAEEX|nr:hypothetical protein CEXT_502851 [Caerostris extrusa]
MFATLLRDMYEPTDYHRHSFMPSGVLDDDIHIPYVYRPSAASDHCCSSQIGCQEGFQQTPGDAQREAHPTR